MNNKVFNQKTAVSQAKIEKLEEDIIKKRVQPRNRKEFQTIYETLTSLIEEYFTILSNITNPVDQKEFNQNFSFCSAFLSYARYVMDILKSYYDKENTFLKEEQIAKDWEFVYTILLFRRMEQDFYILKDFYENEYKEEIYTKTEVHTSEILDMMKNYSSIKHVFDKYLCLEKYASTLSWGIKETKEMLEFKEILEHCKENLDKMAFGNMISFHNLFTYEEISLEKKNEEYKEEIFPLFENSSIDYLPDFQLTEAEIRSKAYCDERRKDTQVNESFLKVLTMSSKIKYLQYILKNLENASSHDYVKIKGKKILCRYKTRYKNILDRISIFVEEYEKEKEKDMMTITVEEERERQKGDKKNVAFPYYGIDVVATERYTELVISFDEAEEAIRLLKEKSQNSTSTKKTSVMLEGMPIYILSADYPYFQTLVSERNRLKTALLEFSSKDLKSYEKTIEDLYQEMSLLKDELKNTTDKARKNKIKIRLHVLKKMLHKENCAKKTLLYRTVKHCIHSSNLSKKGEEVYTQIAFRPKDFLKSKNYSSNTKKTAFANCMSFLQSFKEKQQKKQDVLEVAEYLEEQVNHSNNLLPKNDNQVLKIKSLRKPIKKTEKHKKVKGVVFAACTCIIILALGYIKNVRAQNLVDTNISKIEQMKNLQNDFATLTYLKENLTNLKNVDIPNISDKETVENVELHMHDTVKRKEDIKVWSTFSGFNDSEKDGLNYLGDTTKNAEITGLIYQIQYGTNLIWVSDSDPEWEATCRAYEKMGAVVVGYRSVVEGSNQPDGFFSIESIENVGGRK